MSRYDFAAQRLFVDADLAEGGTVACTPAQTNYLRNVLRLRAGDADPRLQRPRRRMARKLAEAGKRGAALVVGDR